MGLTFIPIRSEEDILKDIIELKNKQAVLNIEQNKLIDELITTNKEVNNGQES